MNYEPLKTEEEVLAFWEKANIYQKVKKKTAAGKPFYFLDGPPFPSGDTHPGTAAGTVTKDALLRFKRMLGFNVRDRPGWDMHGLPIEQRVEKALNLKDKKEIINFGEEKFIDECKKFAMKNMGAMEKDFVRLGVWMPWKEAYITLNPEYMEGVWYGIKCAHENGLIYRGKKTLFWCPHDATSLAKNELEYKSVEDESIFVKLKVKGAKDEYLIIWTTTPWTIPFNMAVMANPKVDYVKLHVDGEGWILAKDRIEPVMNLVKKHYKIVDEFKGKKLNGLEYEHPLKEEMPYHQQKKNAYFVVMSEEFVSTEEGTGLVHCAPGCGPEDFIVGTKNKIPIFNEIDEYGRFSGESGQFIGLKAKDDDAKIIDVLERKGLIAAKTKISHEYAFCWRCHTPIIYRATEQWFMEISKIKDKILKEIDKLYTVPDYAKQNFLDWISNFQDWCITIQRFWNTPFPVWQCNKCKKYEFIGTIKELEKKSKKKITDIHKPVVDKLTWKCECSGMMQRLPDVMAVWFDSGASSWASLDYPRRKDLFEKFFPADFISEGRDQIRAWFSALMNFSMAAFGKAPYKAFYWHGFMLDEQGREMHKSLGNFVPVTEMIKKAGSEPLRLKLLEWDMPGEDATFNWKEIDDAFKAINVLWNLQDLVLNNCEFMKLNPSREKLNEKSLNITDHWILSKLSSLIKEVTSLFESYHLSDISKPLKEFWLEDISRGYVHLSRERLAEKDKTALVVLYKVYMTLLKLLAPVLPITTEAIYQNFKKQLKLKEESLHLFDWPKLDKSMINEKLEKSFKIANEITTAILAGRDKGKIGIRWPLQKAIIYTEDEEYAKSIESLKEFILDQCNLKELSITKTKPIWIKTLIKINYSTLAPRAKDKLPKIVSRFVEISSDAMKAKLMKEGKFSIAFDEETFDVTKDDVYFVDETPKDITGVEFSKGAVYVDLKQTSDLIHEGMARELTRKLQSMRKDAKMIKTQKANAVIAVEEKEIKAALDKYSAEISGRTNSSLKVVLSKTTNEKVNDLLELKGKKFAIGLTPK